MHHSHRTCLALWLLCMGLCGSRNAQAEETDRRPLIGKGPCATESFTATLDVPIELRQELGSSLAAAVTLPAACENSTLFGSPAPLILFINGFQLRASYYASLASRLASWGVAVLQYDTKAFSIVPVEAERRLAPTLAAWVAAAAEDPASPLLGRVDPARLAVAGHSRGGKLATLVYVDSPETWKAAFLVDPVDETTYSPESPANPSATRALAASGLPVAIAAAGIISSCNPAASGYQRIWPAAGAGSWLGVLPGASHSTFAEGGIVIDAAADLLCGKGSDSRAAVVDLVAPQMLNWLWQQLEGNGTSVAAAEAAVAPEAAAPAADGPAAGGPGPADDTSPLPSFFEWVGAQEAAGRLEFQIKETEPVFTPFLIAPAPSPSAPAGQRV